MGFRTIKRYGHERGFSCAFRQWKATDSQCSYIHGYSLGFTFTFEADELDERNWGVDFGQLDTLKDKLHDYFDHTTIVAQDDPELKWFEYAANANIIRVIVLPATGCERFAEFTFNLAKQWLKSEGFAPRCRIVSVEVSEHGSNSAIYSE
jgi:6-pyruvoyltetrahydropterin/6-carboxytetrahydropterin synthase